jgi:hypothetical protein
MDAQSPIAHTFARPGRANVASGVGQPPASRPDGRVATSGFGALPTVLTMVAEAIDVSSSSTTRPSSTRRTRRPSRRSIPASRSFLVA